MPWLSLIAFLVFLSKLGCEGIPQIGAPYYPLVAAAVLVSPFVDEFHRKRFARGAAFLLAATVLLPLILYPARPLIPWRLLPERAGFLQRVREKYEFWAKMRDDLAPLRAELPRDVHDVGYACAFRDTSYGLWKPFGTRAFHEMGIQSSRARFPAQGVGYAVLDARGIEARYGIDLQTWLAKHRASALFTMSRERALVEDQKGAPEVWYLVRFEQNYRESAGGSEDTGQASQLPPHAGDNPVPDDNPTHRP